MFSCQKILVLNRESNRSLFTNHPKSKTQSTTKILFEHAVTSKQL